METNTSKSGLNNVLQAVLSVANEEQSAIYPPTIFSNHYNIVTSFLLDLCVKLYPDKPFVVDLIDPFVYFNILSVKDGMVNLPEDYRNILGSPYVFANPKNTGPCGSTPEINSPAQFRTARNTAACKVNPLEILSEAEFSIRTNSSYNFPTWELPIAYFSGKKQLKICPYDIPKIYLLYTQKEDIYQYGYLPQPDDTYLYDESTTVDSPWGDTAFSNLFRGVLSLYGAYVRDPDVVNYSQILQSIVSI